MFESSVEAAATVVVARPSVWRPLWSEKRAVLHISGLSISGVVVFYTWFPNLLVFVFTLGFAVLAFPLE